MTVYFLSVVAATGLGVCKVPSRLASQWMFVLLSLSHVCGATAHYSVCRPSAVPHTSSVRTSSKPRTLLSIALVFLRRRQCFCRRRLRLRVSVVKGPVVWLLQSLISSASVKHTMRPAWIVLRQGAMALSSAGMSQGVLPLHCLARGFVCSRFVFTVARASVACLNFRSHYCRGGFESSAL